MHLQAWASLKHKLLHDSISSFIKTFYKMQGRKCACAGSSSILCRDVHSFVLVQAFTCAGHTPAGSITGAERRLLRRVPVQALTCAGSRPIGSSTGARRVQYAAVLSTPAACAQVDEVLHELSTLCDVGGAQR